MVLKSFDNNKYLETFTILFQKIMDFYYFLQVIGQYDLNEVFEVSSIEVFKFVLMQLLVIHNIFLEYLKLSTFKFTMEFNVYFR